jgi:hypothetical protein
MGKIFASIALLALAAGSSPPPPGPLPGSDVRPIPPQQAIANAKHLGPGTCEDLKKVRGLPYPGQFGFDPYVDRIMVHFSAYKTCLIESTASTTPIRVQGFPGVFPRTIGDLAHVLLLHGKGITSSLCLPAEVKARETNRQEPRLYEWLADPTHRKKWHACLRHSMAPNNSFKPKPLRGSA